MLAIREEKFHFMVSKQNWSQIIKHYGTYREERCCKPSECTSGLDGFQSIVSFSAYGPCLVIQRSLSDEGNDNSRQCTMYSSVCFNIWIWQERLLSHFEMHENRHLRDGCILCRWRNVGRLVGTGVNVGLLLFLLCVWVEL